MDNPNRSVVGSIAYLMVLTLLLCGCAPTTQRPTASQATVERERQKQQELALEEQVKAQTRLVNVAWPLLEHNVPICKEDVDWRVGAYFANSETFEPEYRDAAKELYGVDDRATILFVAENSPAEASGLQQGDTILEVNDRKLPKSGNVTEQLESELDTALQQGNPVDLLIERDHETHSITLEPAQCCDYKLAVVQNDSINAMADGESVVITTGMMRFTDTDRELALVVGHEIAHNAMGHISSKRGNMAIGLVFDILAAAAGVNTQGAFTEAGGKAFSQDFESEADYVGTYIVARADIEVEESANFWRRMASAHSGAIDSAFNSTHPSTPERFVQIEQTVEEIQQKRTGNEALLPEIKEETAPATNGEDSGSNVSL